MRPVIVLIDTIDGEPTVGTAQAIAAASVIGEPFGIASSDLDLAHDVLLEGWGLACLTVVSNSATAGGRSLDSDAIASAVLTMLDRQPCRAIVAAPTTPLREVVGRVAGRRGSSVVSGVSAIRDTAATLSVICTIDGGLREADVAIVASEPILLLHPATTFTAPSARALEVEWLAHEGTVRPVDVTDWGASAPEAGASLHSARLVVSGGRGLESAEGYSRLRLLAATLGGALGASRAAVESGWAPHDALVGQTGATIAPDVYLALGISGAPQHLAGIRSAGTIIAVNTDARAPILAHADLAAIGDARTVIDGLIERVGAGGVCRQKINGGLDSAPNLRVELA